MHPEATPAVTRLLSFLDLGLPGYRPHKDDLDALAHASRPFGEGSIETKGAARAVWWAAGGSEIERGVASLPREILSGFLGRVDKLPMGTIVTVHPGPADWHQASVRINADETRIAALAAVAPGGWAHSRFRRMFGEIPQDVATRLAFAMHRPGLTAFLKETAADALAVASLDLAERIPNAFRCMDGSISWSGSAIGVEEFAKTVEWLCLDGPGRLATSIDLTVPSWGPSARPARGQVNPFEDPRPDGQVALALRPRP